MKRSCDGRQNCEMEVTTDEFKEDACPSMKKYLYVEYKCIDRSAFKKENPIGKFCLGSNRSPKHGNVSHLVASLATSCQQVVFALFDPSCQQVWNKLSAMNNLYQA